MEIGNGTFLHGDCLELMRDLPECSVDMVMTSPPYDNLRTYNGMPPFTFDAFAPIADQLARVLKPGGVIVWNVADATVNGSETGSSFRQALYFKDQCGLNLHDTMIFEKAGTGACGSNYAYWQAFEYMFVFSKGRPSAINLLTIPGTRTVKGGRRNAKEKPPGEETRTVGIRESRRNNMWRYAVGGASGDDKTDHPAVFPIQMATDHILSWSNPGDTILDPFGGSGTTAIAAENAGRKWICMERDEDYYAAAVSRVWEHVQ